MRIDQVGTPFQRGDHYFIWKKRADDDLWIFYRRKGLDGEDQVVLDPHTLSEDHTTSVSVQSISKDGTLLLYSIRYGGTDETELRVMDVETGQDLPDRFPVALYRGAVLGPDKAGLYYSLQDRDTGTRVRYHELGTDPSKDPVVFGEGYGSTAWVGTWISENGWYQIFTVSHGWDRTEVYYRNLEQGGPIVTLVNDIDASFAPGFAGDRLFMRTNWQAPNGRIMEVDLDKTAPAAWKEVVPEGEVPIQSYSLVGGKLFVRSLHNVVSRIDRYELDGTYLGQLKLPGIGTAGTPGGQWERDQAFYYFSSYTDPGALFRYDVAELTSATQVGHRIDATVFNPHGGPGTEGRRQADIEAAVTVQ